MKRILQAHVWWILMITSIALLTACSMPFQAERAYLSGIFNHAQRTIATLNSLNDLAANAKLGDETWEHNVNTNINTLRNLIAEAQAMQPPAQFIDMHASYLDVMTQLEQVVTTYDQAMALRNNQLLLDAQRYIQQAKDSAKLVQEKATQLRDQYAQ